MASDGMSIPMIKREMGSQQIEGANTISSSSSGIIRSGPLSDFDIHVIRYTATQRWFSPPEIESIVLRYKLLGFTLSDHPPLDPRSGDLYLYNRVDVKNFKVDGISWSKKKGSDRTQETYQTIKIRGVDRMVGVYCKSQDNSTFRKRYYRLICEGPDIAELVFVHYRTCVKGDGGDDKPKKQRSSDTISDTIAAHVALSLDMSDTELLASSFDEETLQELFSWSHLLAESGGGDSMNSSSSSSNQVISTDSSRNIRKSKNCTEQNCSLRPAVSLFQPITSISDFSPSRDSCSGGVKLLVCLSSGLAAKYTHSASLQISFGGTNVPAEVLSPTVLRCRAPARVPGLCTLCVTTMQGQVLSPPTEQLFEYYINIHEAGTSNISSHSSSSSSEYGSTDGGMPPPYYRAGSRTGKRPLALSSSGDSGLGEVSSAALVGVAMENQHKIRIVEKLGLMSNNIDSSAACDPDAGEEVSWLNEHDFSLLQPSDLEKLMDRYLMSVVKQLVQLASVDDELRAELDSLDLNGYSLLHYCCLYNLNALVPILIAKGASISQKTSGGLSSLHLAAGAGYLAVTQMLIEHGADALEVCPVGESSLDKALQAGHLDIVDFLTLAGRNRPPARQCAQAELPSSSGHTGGSAFTSPGGDERSHYRQQSGEGLRIAVSSDGSPRSPATLAHGGMGRVRVLGSDRLLHDALHTLSLADKCALSLTMTQSRVAGEQGLGMNVPGSPRSDRSDGNYNTLSYDEPNPHPRMRLGGGVGGGEHLQDYRELEIDSVFSETDKESLDVAMKMMTSHELHLLEIEARRIQNNVRGWLLRKNYTNLRESARVLQAAWREHKSNVTKASNCSGNSQLGDVITEVANNSTIGDVYSSSTDIFIIDNSVEMSIEYTNGDKGSSNSSSSNIDTDGAMIIDRDQAAARLQAATRRFFARKSFSQIRSQIASTLIIQKQIAAVNRK